MIDIQSNHIYVPRM